MTAVPALIELENVSVERGSTRILDRIHLRIPQGQHVAIVGPNGSGKTTLLKLLMKYVYPSVIDGESGNIRILGHDAWNVWELRTQLGFVSSETDHHFCGGRSARLTAIQTVLTGYSSSELETDRVDINDDRMHDAKHLLRGIGMAAMLDKPVGLMSTGERRRVLLARALVMRPKAIVLDEPTSGLDLVARARFLDQVNALAIAGTQMILVTHHLEEIFPCIQRTILLRAGKIYFDGETRDAIDSSRISSLFDTQVRIEQDHQGFYNAVLGSTKGEKRM
jgi:iron complex transport system ATP-binding protein